MNYSNNQLQLISIKTPVLQKKTIKKLIQIIKQQNIPIQTGDVLVITSKIVSYDEGRLVKLDTVKPSARAWQYSRKYFINPPLAELVIGEANEIYGGVKPVLLTIKNGILVANAGIDQSNAPIGYAVLWPKNPAQSAEKISNLIKKEFSAGIGVIISDSNCAPMRRGTTAFALAIAGFAGTIDARSHIDLFGRQLMITFTNLADQLAAAANALMGEADQQIPAVLIKNAPIKLSDKPAQELTEVLKIPRNECLFREYNL